MTYRASLLVLPALALGGCLLVPNPQKPQTGVVASGEPVAVVDDVKRWTTSYKEKVGETVYKDSDGHKVGTADVYENRTQQHEQKIWYMVQGPERVDDEDFFRITGNTAALEKTRTMRADARSQARKGQIAMGGGIVGMLVTSIFIKQPLVRALLITGSGLVTSGGWYVARSASQQLEADYHAVSRSIAERSSRQYNRGLSAQGKSVSVGYAHAF